MTTFIKNEVLIYSLEVMDMCTGQSLNYSLIDGKNIYRIDGHTKYDKYRLATKITVYHIISKLFLQQIIITNLCGPVSHLTISDLESPSNFQVKEKKNIQIGP